MSEYKICKAHKRRSEFVVMVVGKAYHRFLMAPFFGDTQSIANNADLIYVRNISDLPTSSNLIISPLFGLLICGTFVKGFCDNVVCFDFFLYTSITLTVRGLLMLELSSLHAAKTIMHKTTKNRFNFIPICGCKGWTLAITWERTNTGILATIQFECWSNSPKELFI